MSLEQQLIERLQTLSPTHLEVVNESSSHGGYFPVKKHTLKLLLSVSLYWPTIGTASSENLCSDSRFDESRQYPCLGYSCLFTD